ncbi:MAG: V-type H+-transporting ATPase subunit [Actinobacteria bacterium]|jgi:V/A-type H+-transporting ATPase subunit K|nr:MAG: V-type H+-transporting ATPase subunit [Actinomycetota bacterium]
MIKNKLARMVFGSTFLTSMIVPAIALAQAAEPTVQVDPKVGIAKAASAAVAMSVSAMSAGYAQAKIGAAGAGTLAERPEAGTNIIVLQALPEIIVLLGFVIAFMINA